MTSRLCPCLLLVLVAGSAAAQSAESAATAEALFREARDLVSAGQYAEACDKFAASQRLDPGIGTLLNLADCNARVGRTASAWAQFVEAADLAHRSGDLDRERVAQARAAEIEPRLIRLAILVPAAVRAPGLVVQRDQQVVDPAAWNTAVPVDPGHHVVVATATGKREFRSAVAATQEGGRLEITIPVLEDAPHTEAPPPALPPAAAPPPPIVEPEPEPATSGSAQRTIGIILGGTGIVALVVGSVFGLSARSRWQDASCPNQLCLTHDDQDAAARAGTYADVASVAFIAGGALTVGGGILYLTAPSGLGPASGGVAFGGKF